MNQLCICFEKQSRVFSNQANSQSRKTHLQNCRKVLWCFYLHLPLSQSTSVVLLVLSSCSPVPKSSTWTGGSRTDLICKLLSVITCLEDTWKIYLFIPVLHNSECRWEKWQALLLNTTSGLKIQRCLGQEIWVETYSRLSKARRRNWGEVLWEMRKWKSNCG